MSEPSNAASVARDAVLVMIAREVERAEREFGKGYASAHEAFAVLLEEVDEFRDEVWKKRARRDRVRMVRELVQVACVAQRYAAQLVESGMVEGDAVEREDGARGGSFGESER